MGGSWKVTEVTARRRRSRIVERKRSPCSASARNGRCRREKEMDDFTCDVDGGSRRRHDPPDRWSSQIDPDVLSQALGTARYASDRATHCRQHRSACSPQTTLTSAPASFQRAVAQLFPSGATLGRGQCKVRRARQDARPSYVHTSRGGYTYPFSQGRGGRIWRFPCRVRDMRRAVLRAAPCSARFALSTER